ncbi:MAG: hypothetical protein HY903_21160 [Deltaproteobacteria bacterium]|nr:hypothetical protein [Deltaproteobacteria bacterium]
MSTHRFTLLLGWTLGTSACIGGVTAPAGEPVDIGGACMSTEACVQGAVCLDGVCTQVCDTDAECPKDQRCTDTQVCGAGAGECAADVECRSASLCYVVYCEGGACHGAPLWPAESGEPQPDCPFAGEGPRTEWTGHCDHAGACVGCTELSQCDDDNQCTVDACDPQAVCVHDAAARVNQNCTITSLNDGVCTTPEVGPPSCKLKPGKSCGLNGGLCATGYCVDGVCCESACSGVCQACGADGQCNEMPADDADCGTIVCAGLSSTCRTYSDFDSTTGNRCKAFGQCRAANSIADCIVYADAPSTTECRASAGICDPAEKCSAGACPGNSYSPIGTECRAEGGACDPKEVCTGGSPFCPDDGKTAAGTYCATCMNCNGFGACNSPVAEGANDSQNSCGAQTCNGAGACTVCGDGVCNGHEVGGICPGDCCLASGTPTPEVIADCSHCPYTGACCGDVDGDGYVTSADATAVQRAAVELSSACTLAICDVNNSGAYDVGDAVVVLRIASGLSSTMNCPARQ